MRLAMTRSWMIASRLLMAVPPLSARRRRLKQRNIVVLQTIHAVADCRDGQAGGIRQQQLLGRSSRGREPTLVVGGRDDYRHAVVHLADQLARSRRNDCEGLDRVAFLRRPSGPQPGKRDQRTVAQRYLVGLLFRAPRLPLVKAVRRYETALRLEGRPVGGLLFEGFGRSIDHSGARREI